MITESSKALLQRYLQEDVDENLLNYVATNASGHSILYMSLEQFCTKAGIDEVQAFAFFKAFGVNSFLAFKRILRDCLYCENTEWGVTSRSISSIADDVLRYEIHNLTELAATLDCTMVRRLAQDIQKAGEIIAFGRGATEPYAHNLTRMLRQLGIRAVQPSAMGFIVRHIEACMPGRMPPQGAMIAAGRALEGPIFGEIRSVLCAGRLVS